MLICGRHGCQRILMRIAMNYFPPTEEGSFASGRQGFIVESGLKAFRAFDLGFGRKELDEPDGTFPIDYGPAITFKSSHSHAMHRFPLLSS